MRLRLARNIFELFTKEGRSASVSELKRDGVQRVTLLGADQLAVLIEKALERALEQRVLELSEPEKATILERAHAEFENLRAEVQGLEGEAERKRKELTELESRIVNLQNDFQTASESLDAEIEAAARLDSGAPLVEPDVAVLLSVITQAGIHNSAQAERAARAVADYLRSGRDAAAARASAEQRERVELLEMRLARLNEALERTEHELERALENQDRDEAVASIFKTVQGLRATAKDFERKRVMLKDIFQKNLLLQKGAAAK